MNGQDQAAGDGAAEPRQLVVPGQLLDQIIAEAQAAAPAEVCGVLGGRDELLTAIISVRNIAERPVNRFLMDPLGMAAAQRELDQNRWQLLGYYHSHPSGPARPSRVDRASLIWPQLPPFIWLIISLDSAPPSAAAYWTQDGAFSPVRLVLDRARG